MKIARFPDEALGDQERSSPAAVVVSDAWSEALRAVTLEPGPATIGRLVREALRAGYLAEEHLPGLLRATVDPCTVELLDLGTRARHALEVLQERRSAVGMGRPLETGPMLLTELVACTPGDLISIRNCGIRTVMEIERELLRLGLRLSRGRGTAGTGMAAPAAPPPAPATPE